MRQDRNGWYNGGNAYSKDRPNAVGLAVTTAHEFTHHLQRLAPYGKRCRDAVAAGLVKAPPGLPEGFISEPGP